jgi:Uma2 family endonuclease
MAISKQRPRRDAREHAASWTDVTTLEAFLALPEEKPALEYFHGSVSQKVSPKSYHGGVQFELGRLLYESAGPHRPVRVFTETRSTFGGESPVPDLVLYLTERIPRNADGSMVDDFTSPPDLAVEIISPGQTLTAQRARCRWYIDNGVQVSLLVIPRTESVEVFRPGLPSVAMRGDVRVDLSEILDGLGFVVAELFRVLRLS